ncbi:MAG: PD-(D/E)XK nuclease family transposase [Clostridiaceae bacterium]|nr:PD-(D/E)XK nuclease family transposase [Clostridiaceae bacterium]
MVKIIENEDNFLMSPKNDFAFKMVFGDERNKDILISFLNSVLRDKIEDVELLNTELKKEYLEDKHGILDVRAITDKGVNIDIEIQLLKTRYMPERSLYYWSKMYIEQLQSGDKFSKLKKTITINILDFESLPIEKFHSSFHIVEDETGIKLTDVMEVHFLEMPKLYENKKLDENDDLTQWMMFLESRSKEVLEMLSERNIEIKKAYNILQVMSKDKDARALYLAREMAIHDEATRIEEAEERGKKESSINIAKNLINIGLDEEAIVNATGLTIEEVAKLKRELH